MCVITITLPTVPSLTYEGRCDGEITQAPVGKNGFGYDPIFYYRPLNKTFAQMLPEENNEISHRGRAMGALRRDFERVMMWLHSYGAQQWSKASPFRLEPFSFLPLFLCAFATLCHN